MLLALRHSLPPDASLAARVGSGIIKARLVSEFSHGGIVINGDLYHSNAKHGVHVEKNPDLSGFMLIDLGKENDALALKLFSMVDGKKYDWVSLLAFVVPGVTDSQRWYCFELCWLLMTGTAPKERITGETLLVEAFKILGLLMTPAPEVKSVLMRSSA